MDSHILLSLSVWDRDREWCNAEWLQGSCCAAWCCMLWFCSIKKKKKPSHRLLFAKAQKPAGHITLHGNNNNDCDVLQSNSHRVTSKYRHQYAVNKALGLFLIFYLWLNIITVWFLVWDQQQKHSVQFVWIYVKSLFKYLQRAQAETVTLKYAFYTCHSWYDHYHTAQF